MTARRTCTHEGCENLADWRAFYADRTTNDICDEHLADASSDDDYLGASGI